MSDVIFPALNERDVIERMKKAKKTLILTHTNPDGDCVGSAGALAVILRALGSEARVAAPDKVQARLRFLIPEQDDFAISADDDDVNSYDTVISVDVASRMQLASLNWLSDRIDFMIDHHVAGEPFAPYLVDSCAPASGEIVWRLCRLLRDEGTLPIIPDAARRCYAAVVSDTGSFKFANVTPNTHIAAAEMLKIINDDAAAGAENDERGMSTEQICRSLFSKRTMKDLILQLTAIRNLTLYADGKLGAVMLSAADLTEAGLEEGDTGAAVEIPRSLDGVEIAIAVKQSLTEPKKFKISSRSNGEADVSSVCAALGGGGHVKAAGCSIIADSAEEAMEAAVEAFSAAIAAIS